MKIRIGYGLGTQGMTGDGERYASMIDDLERLRFDSAWFSERITGLAPDPCSAMAFAAGRTKRLKFGMSVMVLPGRNPILVAKELASIDLLSNGRLLPAFGLGVADPREQAGFGVAREDRAPMFNEALALMRRLWNEDNVTHEGRFYKCADLTLRPKPKQSPMDVWLGGFAPSELRRVGRYADGWLPSFVTPIEAKGLLDTVNGHAEEAGRKIDPEHFGALIVYSSGAPLGGAFVERIKARRPDVNVEEMYPVGIPAIRETIERFVEAGFSKFVLLPAMVPDNFTAELETIAAGVLDLEN